MDGYEILQNKAIAEGRKHKRCREVVQAGDRGHAAWLGKQKSGYHEHKEVGQKRVEHEMVSSESNQDDEKKVCWKRWRKRGVIDAAAFVTLQGEIFDKRPKKLMK